MTPSLETTVRGLAEVAPRARQVLIRRFVEQRTRAQFADLYGVDEEHGDLLVWKAVTAFEAALAHMPAPGPLEVAVEYERAAALNRSLDSGREPPASLAVLVTQAEAVRRALEREALEADASPQRAREDWLRRVAMALIAAFAGYFYWRDHYGPKERKPPEARVPLPSSASGSTSPLRDTTP